MIAPLSASYADARAAFLDAAAAAGATIESFPHPLRGLHDEDLAVDVAEIAGGPDVVIVVSGTHGVEGYAGSALQRHHLTLLADEPLPAAGRPTLVFVHALNPFGFSWVRRVNEDNVDLNRNFPDWSQPLPVNDGYAELADILVPSEWTPEVQERTTGELFAKVTELGLERMQQIISGGQYDHPLGLFHGGTGPTWSHRWLREFVGRRLQGVARAAVIDLHTGLGPWAHGELISSEHPGSDVHQRILSWWPDATAVFDGSSVSAVVSGDWLADVHTFAPGTEITGITIEYGTVDPITNLQALRADAWLHGHGDPRGPEGPAVRAALRASFADDDPAWLEQLWPRYLAVTTTAVERLATAS